MTHNLTPEQRNLHTQKKKVHLPITQRPFNAKNKKPLMQKNNTLPPLKFYQ